jgi:alpha-tubulin suppressor-like RCC1 family protein
MLGEITLWVSWAPDLSPTGRTTCPSNPTLRICADSALSPRLWEGAGHTLAILYNGDVFVWGSNTFGQLGLGDKIDRYNPTLLRLANQARIAHASGGLLHSLVVDENGNVWGFGGNSSGQCGDGDRQDLESPVQTSVSATYVAAGKFFSACAGN